MVDPLSSNMKLVLITADPQLASRAQRAGVGRVMVDLERLGKFERQKCRDTWISKHEIADIAPVRSVLTTTDLLVRLNPLHAGSAKEIDAAVEGGADLVMLPMFTSIEEIEAIAELLRGRCKLVPLVETGPAFAAIGIVAQHRSVDEVFIGLNDLHMWLDLDFMFEPLVDGSLEIACEKVYGAGKPFGFGGIARIGEGDLSADLIMREHARLGSTRVHLSRTFARGDDEGDIKSNDGALRREVSKLLEVYDSAETRDQEDMARDMAETAKQVERIKSRIRLKT